MSRTLVQISLLTLLVFASFTDAFAQRSANLSRGEVIGNRASSRMSVIKEPLSRSNAVVAAASTARPAVRVTVVGQVTAPGVYEFRNGAPDLREVIEQAGNLTRFCPQQFFVWRSKDEQWPLDAQDADFKFEDGDILLAETSTHYYESLGKRDKAKALAEIHPVTQIVLLNVLDRPVVLALRPQDAKFSVLASLLNQAPNSLLGRFEKIEPPNAYAIPADALIAPDMICSGAILRFDPGVINRAKLPPLPDPVLVKAIPKIQTASVEATMPDDDARPHNNGSLMVQPVKSEGPAPFAPNLSPSTDMGSVAEAESDDNPFADVFEEFEAASDETLNSEAPEVLLPGEGTPEQRPMLSTQQWRIIVTFVTLMSLFLAAWCIRHRQQNSGMKTHTFVESRIATSSDSESSPSPEAEMSGASTEQAAEEKAPAKPEIAEVTEASEPQTVETLTADPSPVDDERDKILELDSLHDRERKDEAGIGTGVMTEAHELSSYDSPRSEDFVDEKVYEVSIEELSSGSEIDVFDQVESPCETPAEIVASISEHPVDEESTLEAFPNETHHVIDDLEQQPTSRVQQSLLGTPWMQELSSGLNPQESDISLGKQEEQQADAPAAEAEVEEAKPQTVSGRFAAQQLRIDQAHTHEPRPAIRPHVSEPSSEQPPGTTESVSEPAGRIEPPSAAANWMKMADHPPTPEENLDHIFQAIMRERKK